MAEEARRIGLIEAAAPDPGAVMAAFRLPGTPVAMTPVGFAAQLKDDLARWAPIVKASGFSAED